MTKLLCVLLLVFDGLSLAFCGDQTVRDNNGRIVATISDTTGGRTVRDNRGKIMGRIEETVNGKIVRDENGRIIGRIEPGTSDPRK